MRAVRGHDEELAAGGIRHHAARHRQNAVGVLERVVHAVHGEFTLDVVAGAADARALGVAALNHEARNDTVKNQPVIEAAVCQRNKIADGLRRSFRVEFALHFAAIRHRNNKSRILCHVHSTPFRTNCPRPCGR